MRTFVDNIVVKDAAAKRQMLAIWDEARQSGLTEENMIAYIDRWEADLQQSQHLNFLRWPILNQRVHQNPPTKGSFQAEVEVLRTYMKERFAWMDKKLGYTYRPNAISELPLDKTQPYQVFSLSGQPCGNSIESLSPGIYIVRQGSAAQKIVVR
jgi:hypothetical protein